MGQADNFHAFTGKDLIEGWAELGVAIADKEAGSRAAGLQARSEHVASPGRPSDVL